MRPSSTSATPAIVSLISLVTPISVHNGITGISGEVDRYKQDVHSDLRVNECNRDVTTKNRTEGPPLFERGEGLIG
jgi:hypothetical protein